MIRRWMLAVCAVVAAGLMAQAPSPDQAHAANVIQVTAGASHSCALLLDKTVMCWGSNSDGQLGDGTITNRTTPVFVLTAAGGSPITGIQSIDAGERHTCAVTTSGGAKCWGSNAYGQVGDGTIITRTSPVSVSGLTSGTKSVAAGGLHTCAVTTAGGAKCWGLNITGQLGDGTIVNRTTPVDVSGLTSGVEAIAAAGVLFWGHSCAATTAAGAKCWGDNGFGQLGDGTTTGHLTPVDVLAAAGGSPITGIAGVSIGSQHSCAITTGGGAKCWGDNSDGQLGDGTVTNRTTPVNVSGLTSGVASVAGGAAHTCAVTTNAGAKCWGDNANGKLGNGSTTDSAVPVDVSGLTHSVVGIAGGGMHSCAVRYGGVRCWGANSSGQLGNDTTTGSTTPVMVSGFEKSVGGIAAAPDIREDAFAASAPSGQGPGAGQIAAVAAALALSAGAAAWYARRRWRRISPAAQAGHHEIVGAPRHRDP